MRSVYELSRIYHQNHFVLPAAGFVGSVKNKNVIALLIHLGDLSVQHGLICENCGHVKVQKVDTFFKRNATFGVELLKFQH